MKRIRIFISLLAAFALLAGLCALPAAAADTSGYAAEVLRLVNAERKKAGLAEVAAGSPSLYSAARKRAEEIAVKFDHKRPDGSTCFTVLDDYNVSYVAGGENIAAGYATPAAVMEGWMASPGHKANILGNYESLGVGVYVKDGRLYWSQMFIRKGSVAQSRWAAWPAWLRQLVRVLFFGWIWMR